MNFSNTAATYLRRERLTIRVMSVDNPELRDWVLSVRSFCKRIYGDPSSPLTDQLALRRSVIALRLLSSELSTTPACFTAIGEVHKANLNRLTETLVTLENAFPDLVQEAQSLIGRGIALTELSSNPLLEYALKEGFLDDSEGRVRIILARPKLREMVMGALSELGAVGVTVSESKTLDHDLELQRVLCIGPPAAFRETLLFAPASQELVFLSYSFLGSLPTPQSLDPGTRTSVEPWHAVGLPVPDFGEQTESADLAESRALETEFVIPNLDWSSFVSDIREDAPSSSHQHGTDLVRARPILLSNESVVLMPAHERARGTVVQFTGGEAQVKQRRIEEIEAGTYLLLRTEGGGDLMRALAQRLLGEKFSEIEDAQLKWKNALKSLVHQRGGLLAAEEWLQGQGVLSATRGTLNYWLSPYSIQPKSKSDFGRLMEVLGLGDQAKETWAKGRALNKARHSAGNRIRNRLLSQISGTSKSAFSSGKMVVSFDNIEGGEFTAWQVLDVGPTVIEVQPNRIGLPESIEEQLWLS